MQSLPQIQLVDIHGRPITTDDQGDAATWPRTYETDCVHYELPPAEMIELEAAALEAETDRHDAPSPGEARWLSLMWSGSLPPAATPTDDELAQLAAHGAI
jgi:hypothetical protein